MKNKSKRKYPPGIFVPLWEIAPEIAEKETRKVCLTQDAFGLPKGIYLLMESYCPDTECGCRKVMINVVSVEASKIMGTIGFGWESEKYYTKWAGDKSVGSQMTGTYEEIAQNILTDQGNNCLKLVKNSLRDLDYINSIKNHYQIFKELNN